MNQTSKNSLEKIAQNLIASHIEGAVNNLASEIVGTTIKEVKSNITPKRFMRRLCCSENLKKQSKNSSE